LAVTQEKAISKVQTAILEKLSHIETIPWDIPIPLSESVPIKFAGIFIVAAGVPREQIVLAFHPPDVRPPYRLCDRLNIQICG
jgi:hypothetical protein